MAPDLGTAGCCGGGRACVFAKALLARTATCDLAQRALAGEQEVLACGVPTARVNCATLAALLQERARFALRLPGAGRPLMHVQALQLQCGGLAALRATLAVTESDVHRLLLQARERHGSLAELPWGDIVAAVARWQPRRRSRQP